ncbi:hypothetical protein, partial [Candidatus Cardinium sp. cBcalN2]
MYHKIKIIPIKDLSLVFLLYIGLVISGCTSRLRLNAVKHDYQYYRDAKSRDFICSRDYKDADMLVDAFDELIRSSNGVQIDENTYKEFIELAKSNLKLKYGKVCFQQKQIYRSILSCAIQTSCAEVVECLLDNEFSISFFGPLPHDKQSYQDTIFVPSKFYLEISEKDSRNELHNTYFLHESISVIKQLMHQGADVSSAFKVFSLLIACYPEFEFESEREYKPKLRYRFKLGQQVRLGKQNILHMFLDGGSNHPTYEDRL